jgi:aminopeptidase-like protein
MTDGGLVDLREIQRRLIPEEAGAAMHALIRELYPICRSITGDGVRETLRRIARDIPLKIHEIPTGTRVLDWTIPKEWNIKGAYIKRSDGSKVVDFSDSNLHVLNYSAPVHETLTLEKLREHLSSMPEHPDWIPYRTSYFAERWGFCLSHKQLAAMREGLYEVRIDSSLSDGHLTYGEICVPGRSTDEVLLSCHVCHPSLCNDNLSGIALCAFLAQELSRCSLRYSYRFLFIPGTIGAITWLARNEKGVERIRHGLVVAGVGDAGAMTYKRSRRGDAEIDRAVARVLVDSGDPHELVDFSPHGYDERQYCSPGFNLPVGSLTRTPHGRYAEYHTSADGLDFVRPASLGDSFAKYLSVIGVLERNRALLNRNPKGEPQLGRRGLYRDVGGHVEARELESAMLWVLNLSDGGCSLLDIAERSRLRFEQIETAAGLLEGSGLLTEIASARGDAR